MTADAETVDDAALVARCIAGDGTAWNALVQRYQRLVYAIVRRIRMDEHAAADVFQTVFARLIEKADNWLQFLGLPQASRQACEIALRMDPLGAAADRAMFGAKGWKITDSATLRTFDNYRSYFARSRAEFSVAHNRYVEFARGWFSDRSALYLASGRPVLVQSTGIEPHLPTGKGLLTFSTLDEAVAGVESINADYSGHCRAARAIAAQYFDADKLLVRVLEQIGR